MPSSGRRGHIYLSSLLTWSRNELASRNCGREPLSDSGHSLTVARRQRVGLIRSFRLALHGASSSDAVGAEGDRSSHRRDRFGPLVVDPGRSSPRREGRGREVAGNIGG